MRLAQLLLPIAAIAVCAGCAFDVGAPEELASDDASLVGKNEIERFWKRFDDENIEKGWASENGGRKHAGDYLAWHESFRQLALLDMYVASEDPAFLDVLVERAKVVLSLRDDQRGKQDEVRGKVMRAWGRYPDVGSNQRSGVWVCEVVQNGMISYPIAAFVKLAHHSPKLRKRYGAELIDRFRSRLVETVEAFDGDWDDMGDEGFYRFPDGYEKVYAPFEGKVLHYNRALALGRTLMMLEDAGVGDQRRARYRERVRKIARFFLRDTRTSKSGSAVWNFSKFNPTVENVNHGGIVAEFISLAGRRDYSSVGSADVARFIETFRRITRDRTRIASLVDGSMRGLDRDDANSACGRWLDLADFDAQLVKRCAWALGHGYDEKQVGYAKTLRYR